MTTDASNNGPGDSGDSGASGKQRWDISFRNPIDALPAPLQGNIDHMHILKAVAYISWGNNGRETKFKDLGAKTTAFETHDLIFALIKS